MSKERLAAPHDEALRMLRSSPYFRGLSEQHLQQLVGIMEERRYGDGGVLVAEGAPRMEAFFIAEGTVERSRLVSGRKCVYEIVEPGAAFGILHSLREDPSYATCVAQGHVRALVMPASALQALLDSDASLGKGFTNSLAKAVRDYTKLVHRPVSTLPRVVLYDSREYWRREFDAANAQLAGGGFDIKYVAERFSPDTAAFADGAVAVVCFVNDDPSRLALQRVHAGGCRMLAMRCAGYDRVDLAAAEALGILVTRVPEYSPFAVAEHAMALAMALNRRLCRAYMRTRDHDFTLEGLLGFDFHGRTAGVLGTGRIGRIFIDLCLGFGMRVVCYDKFPFPALQEGGRVEYKATADEVMEEADVLSLHLPLLPETRHTINAANIAKMKDGVLIINCGRGALIDTPALIEGLQSGRIGGAGLDVYENETDFFFADHSDTVIKDPVLQRLLQFHNVILTGHQAFFTKEGLQQIARVSLDNIRLYLEGKDPTNHPNAVRS